MRPSAWFFAALLPLLGPLPAAAALKIGDRAPDFSLAAALGGCTFTFSCGPSSARPARCGSPRRPPRPPTPSDGACAASTTRLSSRTSSPNT